MSADGIDVKKIAALARLDLSPDEIARYQVQLAHVLDYMEQLGRVNVDNVTATAHPHEIMNVLRDDVAATVPEIRERILANAPEARDGQFVVPKIIE